MDVTLCRFAVCVVALAAGCDAAGPPATEAARPEIPARGGTHFEPCAAGAVRGRVVWAGSVPAAPPAKLAHYQPPGPLVVEDRPLPLLPAVDPATRGLGGAVVCLEDADPARSRPWDHPPARVEMRDGGHIVRQGDGPAGWAGVVRRGDAVEFVSRQAVPHLAQVRGAAFFTLALPDPDRPHCRALDRPGVVEVSSGAGYHWLRGYLFVTEHPYWATTAADGSFALDGVPPGRYRLACRVPEWTPDGHDRDPETLLVFRTHLPEPRSQSRTVEVRAGETASAQFIWDRSCFSPPRRTPSR